MSLLAASSRAFATTSHLSPSYPTNNGLRDRDETESIRHLLSETSSLAPSDAISIQTGERTPRASSPAPSQHQNHRSAQLQNQHPQQQQPTAQTTPDQTEQEEPYRGFASKKHYLAALQAWADEQRYIPVQGTTLVGFYGAKTMEQYASEPALDLGIKRKWRERRERKRSLVAASSAAAAAAAAASVSSAGGSGTRGS